MNYKEFNKKYNLTDSNQYDAKLIERLNAIVSGQSIGISNGQSVDQHNDSIEALYAGNYENYETKNYILAERYYLMAIEHNNSVAMNNIGTMYEDLEKYDQVERYYLMAVEHNHVGAMYNIGKMYNEQKKYDLAERYYLMAVKHNHVGAMNNIAYLYEEQKKYDSAERYYLMAVEHNNEVAMNNIGLMYREQKKYDLAEQYFLMAVEHNHKKAMNNIAYLYEEQKKYDLAERYYLMAVEHNHVGAMNHLSQLITPLKMYTILMSIDKKNQLIADKIKELEKDRSIRFIGNKIKLLGKKSECPVCFEIKLTIPRECAHSYCLDCYIRIEDCAMGCDK